MGQPDFELTQTQIDGFHNDQILSIDRLTDDEDVAHIRDIYDRLIESKAGWDTGDQYDLGGLDDKDQEPRLTQLLWPSKYAPELEDCRLLSNATRLTKQLFGEQARCFIFHFIYKAPLTGVATPWHQDASYWPIDADYQAISIWVPLQDVGMENGCMQFVPGSHELGILPHQSIDNDPRIHGNELAPAAMKHVRDPVVCPLSAGGATIHGPRVLHYTAPNRSTVRRRAVILLGEVPHETDKNARFYPWMEEKRTLREKRQKKHLADQS